MPNPVGYHIRSPGQALLERTRVAQWYCQGVTHAEIAERLGISLDMAYYEVAKVKAIWAATRKDHQGYLDQELAKLDNLEREAWSAWLDSRKPKLEATEEGTTLLPKGNGVQQATDDESSDLAGKVLASIDWDKLPHLVTRRTRKVRQSDGDPRLLQVVYACIDRRIKLLGLDAPVKIQQVAALRDLAQGIESETGVAAGTLIAEAERIAAMAAARQLAAPESTSQVQD
jgi:hypothetical protein